ncbi:hypothetical protein DL765_006940 [Monosporascus sp. GIB2]|nr:hypothetical protein DL765_006940 [Monosporascus sp. GIB2]
MYHNDCKNAAIALGALAFVVANGAMAQDMPMEQPMSPSPTVTRAPPNSVLPIVNGSAPIPAPAASPVWSWYNTTVTKTVVVDELTTVCPTPTVLTFDDCEYTASVPFQTLVVTNCPCTVTSIVPTLTSSLCPPGVVGPVPTGPSQPPPSPFQPAAPAAPPAQGGGAAPSAAPVPPSVSPGIQISGADAGQRSNGVLGALAAALFGLAALTILDYGDIQTAWHTAGMSSTAAVPARPKPNLQQIRSYVPRLLEEVSRPPASEYASSRAAGWGTKKVMMTARTLLLFRFGYFKPGLGGLIILVNGDASGSAVPWANVPAPLPFSAIAVHINARRGQLAILEIQCRDAQLLRHSVRQLHWNRGRTLQSLRPVRVSILRELHEDRVDVGTPIPNSAQAGNGNAAHAVYGREVYVSGLHDMLHGQLMLVADAYKREHYRAVTHFEGVMLGYGATGRNSGTDARFTLDLTRDDWKCFEGTTEAVVSDVRYGRGRYPNLPDHVVARWITGNQPLMPCACPHAFPYGFGPHLITSGVYINPPNVLPANAEFWPRWTNIKSYEAHKW